MLTRRVFLISSVGALTTSLSFHRNSLAIENFQYRLELKPSKASLLADNDILTDVWAYDGIVPGPTIRARKGQEISIEVVNLLDQPTTIHWHGIRIENSMDGVAGLTQPPIQPGESFIYRFTPPDAGTYWYHPHNRSWEQLARGLYGALIVEGDAKSDSFDRDYLILVDDWRLDKKGQIDEASFGSLHDWSHGGRLGNELTLNGKAYERLEVTPGDRVRLRLVNTANARVLRFAIEGHVPFVIALDGQAIDPITMDEKGISIAPSQRVDLLVDIKGKPGDEIRILETSGNEGLIAGHFVCVEGQRGSILEAPIFTLLQNDIPGPNLENAAKFEVVMTGGAMRFLASGIYQGEQHDGRTLATEYKQMWAFNGMAGMSMSPFFSVAQGKSVIIDLVNETLWPHAIHFHGHHFRILSRHTIGKESTSTMEPYEETAFRDTVLVERDESVKIAFVADNPGKWMIHCHMLEHQASGMGTWFEIT